jgi:hypothetical protein
MVDEVPPLADVEGWPVMSESDELRRLRRDAESLGLAVTKIPQRSRSFHEFGPYMLTDPRAGYAILASGLDLEDVEKWLLSHRHKSEQWRTSGPVAGLT